MWKRVYSFLVGEDEAINGLIGPGSVPAAGNPHFTISQRLAEMRTADSRFGCIGCKILSILFKPFYWNVKNYDHCAEAMKDFPSNLPSDG